MNNIVTIPQYFLSMLLLRSSRYRSEWCANGGSPDQAQWDLLTLFTIGEDKTWLGIAPHWNEGALLGKHWNFLFIKLLINELMMQFIERIEDSNMFDSV